MSNPVDEAREKRRRKAEQDALVEQATPAIIGVLGGIAQSLRELIGELREQRAVTIGLTDELHALRVQRANGGNGHAPGIADDNHEEGG